MGTTAALAVFAIVLSVIVFVLKATKRPDNYPPGPTWLPVVGNLPELKKLSKKLGGQHLALWEMAKKYNTNILGLKLGKDYVITVCSYQTVKTVLTSDEYDGRPDNFFIRLRSMGTRKGITCTDGELWKIQRNFVTTHLRNLGFGRKPMDLMIKEEISEILSILQENGKEVEITTTLAPGVINILWALTSGSRINRKDPLLPALLALLNQRRKAFDMSGGTLTQHPWLRFFFPEMTGYNLITKLNKELKKLLMKTIEEHKTSWSEGRDDDLIYNFLNEMRKEGNATFTEQQLVMVCLDIFIAGSETTSNTLGFAFLMMILYPGVQKKVHQCIDEALRSLDQLEYSDRHKVPYVEAVLLETERYCHVTPVTGPRRVLRDTILEGYFIPKETTVLINMYSVHNDESYWKDPAIFRPERFLDENGKLFSRDRLLTFGLGKRRCLGEILARNCIFMFFTEILRKFEVELLPGSEKPTGKPIPGITLSPERYKVKFNAR